MKDGQRLLIGQRPREYGSVLNAILSGELMEKTAIFAVSLVFLFLFGCSGQQQEEVAPQQSPISASSNVDLIRSSLTDLPAGFSMEKEHYSNSSSSQVVAVTFQNREFEEFDLSSYEKAKNIEYISEVISIYSNDMRFKSNWEKAVDMSNNPYAGTEILYINHQGIGDENYVYKTTKSIVVEGKNSVIVGIIFKRNSVIASISDSGFDSVLLESRVFALAKSMDKKIAGSSN